jgi:ATP-dependent RNA helicase SUPV3L1/SUV3
LQEMVKPKPARLISLLVAYGAGGNKKPWIPFAGVTSIPNEGELASSGFTQQALSLAGYRAVGPRIIRFDILNRLSFLIRQAQDQFKETKTQEARGHKFQIMAEMLALLGSTYGDVQGVLTALGYKAETSETRLTRDPATEAETTADTAAATPKAMTSTEATPDTKLDTSANIKPEAKTEDAPAIPPAAPTGAPATTPRKPQSQKHLSLYNHRITDDAGETTEIENLEYWYFPSRGQKGFKLGGRGKPAFKGKNQKGPKPRRNAPKNAKPPTQKQVENSPFAALAALKNPKKD